VKSFKESHVGKCYYGKERGSEGTPSSAITYGTKSTLSSLSLLLLLLSFFSNIGKLVHMLQGILYDSSYICFVFFLDAENEN
jgi:hypothetical protein